MTTSTTTTTGNWWDKLGKPQYGGTFTLQIPQDVTNWDPYGQSGYSLTPVWQEPLFGAKWTLDPAVFNYSLLFIPPDYIGGELAKSWEFADPSTLVIHLNQGIHWQNIPPANGREFTADDVVWHYNHMYGLGSGYTKASSFASSASAFVPNVASITASDKYTVVFKWKSSNPEFILETIQAVYTNTLIQNPEATQQWGNLQDWHHAVGTGPFILTDFVSGASATFVKNPNYYGYDERYPQNQLPYINGIKYLIIPDQSTALAALRSGKIDALDQMSLTQSQSVKKTNPEILQTSFPTSNTPTIDPRVDKAPYTDIRVREAMQLAIDLPTIASGYYGGTCSPNPCALTTYFLTGWGLPYDQWPQDLKDQYTYNPTQAKQLLTAAGFPNGFNTNITVQNTVDLDLLQIIKSYFSAVGINMDIVPMDPASWTALVQQKHQADALVQRLSGGMALGYAPLRQFNKFQKTDSSDWLMVSDPTWESFYPQALAATSTDAIKKLLRDANEYELRQHWEISLLQPSVFALTQPWLKGYYGQNLSISGGNSAPMLASFFLSRFWVDGTLKKSMGR
jgi:peptide/nickel transport system substrate-binding protein